MISLNLSDTSTVVTNSRSSKKRPVVWRRRKSIPSGKVFTTYERISLADNKPVILAEHRQEKFNLGKLLLSISRSLAHNSHSAEYDSLWLAQTIEDRLSMDDKLLTPASIAATTYMVLKHFDAIAGIHYGATHGLVSNVRRRGRPSLNE